jgi:membrane-associated phospholipid phosphatase
MRKTLFFKPLFSTLAILILLVSTSAFSLENTKTEEAGDDIQKLIIFASLASSIFHEKGNEGTYQFLKAFVTSQVLVHELKELTDKTRPNGKCCNSFPSGHASASFTSAAFIHDRYGWEYAIPAYIASSYVSYSRVYADKHFVKDVLAGAVVGLLSGFYFTDKYENVKIIPTIKDKQVGIYFSMTFD